MSRRSSSETLAFDPQTLSYLRRSVLYDLYPQFRRKQDRPFCEEISKTTGEQCKARAVVGDTRCRRHGGFVPSEVRDAVLDRVQAILYNEASAALEEDEEQ